MKRFLVLVIVVCGFGAGVFAQTVKPKLTLDEFFNSVSFPAVKVSPDGSAVVIAAERADWEQQIFRKELWLYRAGGSSAGLVQWSPDGQWIAFLSERKATAGKDADAADDSGAESAQLMLISPNGGEAFAITSGSERVHSFAWAADSKAIYFATREPWNKQQTDDHKKDWKDVIRYRGDERGDVIWRIGLEEALARHAAVGARELAEGEKDTNATPGAVARTTLRADEMVVSRDGRGLAFVTSSVSQRQEKVGDVEIYTVNLAGSGGEIAPSRLTHNEGVELHLEWAEDNRHLFFQVDLGSVEGKYEDPQPRLYWVDAGSGKVERWFKKFEGEVVRYTPTGDRGADVFAGEPDGGDCEARWMGRSV